MENVTCPVCGKEVAVVSAALADHSPPGQADELAECPGSGMDISEVPN